MKFLKKFLKFIKNIFIKEKCLEKTNVNDEIVLEDRINYDELYSNLEFGDIIWAKRYKTEEDLIQIPEGHEEGPYLVFKTENNKVYCFYGTSILPDFNMFITLNNIEYNLTKETYFSLHKIEIIDKFSLIKKLCEINENDKNNLYRKIKCFRREYHDKEKIINIEFPRQCGDIISLNDKKYIVLDIENDKLKCIPMGYINQDGTNLNYSNVIILGDDSNIITIGALSNKQLIGALGNYKEYLKNIENINQTQRGSIIYKENKYYYIYGEDKDSLLAFEITKIPIKDYDNLVLGNTYFYTSYNERVINKKDDYKNIYLCLKQEMDIVKSKRKAYKNSHQTKKEPIIQISDQIKIGSYVKLNEFSDEVFYVCEIIGNVIVCVAQAERGQNKIKKHYFNKENVILTENFKKRR